MPGSESVRLSTEPSGTPPKRRCLMRLLGSFSVLVFLAATMTAFAQSAKPLTNQDVVQMVNAGLDNQTIIKAIQANQTNFDVSPQALIMLKSGGVNQTVIQAMLSRTTAEESGVVPSGSGSGGGQSPPPSPAISSSTVVLAGTGPTPHLQTVLDGVSDMLSSKGVKVEVPSGEARARVVVLEDMKKSEGSDLLYLSVNQVKGQRGKILAECFVNGSKVWEEDVRGSFMAVSAEGEVRGMLEAINKKIEKHIGGPGLPK